MKNNEAKKPYHKSNEVERCLDESQILMKMSRLMVEIDNQGAPL